MAVASLFDLTLDIVRGGNTVATVRGMIDSVFVSRMARAMVARYSTATHLVYVGGAVDLRDGDTVRKTDGTQFSVLQVMDISVGRRTDHKMAVTSKV